MGEEQTKLFESFEAAEEHDILNSKYFKPLTNIKYELTFQKFANGRDWEIRELNGTDYNDKTKIVKTAVLVVRIASIDGHPVDQEFSMWNKGGRAAMQGACESGTITRKKFSFKVSEEKGKKVYSFSELGDK